jgi:hypothetical protein
MPDDIISYNQLVAEEKANPQKAVNFGIGKKYSVFLMSVRSRGWIIYHDSRRASLRTESHHVGENV